LLYFARATSVMLLWAAYAMMDGSLCVRTDGFWPMKRRRQEHARALCQAGGGALARKSAADQALLVWIARGLLLLYFMLAMDGGAWNGG
jgi:hypothetical protein